MEICFHVFMKEKNFIYMYDFELNNSFYPVPVYPVSTCN